MEQEFSEFRESDKSMKHNLESSKDPVSHTRLAGTVVYKAKGDRFEPYCCNDKYICQ